MKITRIHFLAKIITSLSFICGVIPINLSAMENNELPPIYSMDGMPIPFFTVIPVSHERYTIATNPEEFIACSPSLTIMLHHEDLPSVETPIAQLITPEPMSKNKEGDKPQSSLYQTSIKNAFHAVKPIVKSTKSKSILMTHFAVDRLEKTHDIMCHLCENDQMIFSNPQNLQDHITAIHMTNKSAKKYQKKCPVCDQLYYRSYLPAHMVQKHGFEYPLKK